MTVERNGDTITVQVKGLSFQIMRDIQRCHTWFGNFKRVRFSKKELDELDALMKEFKTNVVMMDDGGYYHITMNLGKLGIAPAY